MPYRDPDEQRRYQREWVARRRSEWLAEHGPCVRCGSSKDMEVDHVDSAEKVSHRIWSWSKARREAELAKCQVLCGDCHREKSIPEQVRLGAENPRAIMTEEQVREIRDRVASGESQISVARAFKMTKQYVSEVVNRKTWKHI